MKRELERLTFEKAALQDSGNDIWGDNIKPARQYFHAEEFHKMDINMLFMK